MNTPLILWSRPWNSRGLLPGVNDSNDLTDYRKLLEQRTGVENKQIQQGLLPRKLRAVDLLAVDSHERCQPLMKRPKVGWHNLLL